MDFEPFEERDAELREREATIAAATHDVILVSFKSVDNPRICPFPARERRQWLGWEIVHVRSVSIPTTCHTECEARVAASSDSNNSRTLQMKILRLTCFFVTG